jgi:hypothetical protein
MKINKTRAKMVERVLMIRAIPASDERFVPIIPEPTTTHTSRVVPKNSATVLPNVVAIPQSLQTSISLSIGY